MLKFCGNLPSIYILFICRADTELIDDVRV